MEKKRYGAIDGLRTIACIGIVLMHILTNGSYELSGFAYDKVIHSFTDFVFLFMMISAFGMCCGYYERMLKGKISISDFYAKRYKKILPFFAVLVLLDILVSPSLGSLYEGFADITLLFGLLPNGGHISVIGVGWFLGVVFVFYLVFPFFCFLLENKKRAWFAFAVSLIYNFACIKYFDVSRTNILYCACYFLAGGLVFLYKDKIPELKGKWRVIMLVLTVVAIVPVYAIGRNTATLLVVFMLLLIYTISVSSRLLENRFTKFFSGISMEVYLAHMMIFRILEKLKLNTLFGRGLVQYIVMVVTVLLCTVIFAVLLKKLISLAESKITKIREKIA